MKKTNQIIKDGINLIRIKHWLKNLLVFVPAIFGGVLFDLKTFASLIIVFFAFCGVSSGIYIINDIKDIEKDRRHEIKKNRPLAAGRISISIGIILSSLLCLSGVSLLLLCQQEMRIQCLVILVSYFILNLLYSCGLKNKPILDVMLLASGFVLQVLMGSVAGKVELSQWLLLTILTFSLYMGLGKRRNELRKANTSDTRTVLKYYTADYLNKIMLMTMTLGVGFYSLWAAIVVKNNSIMVWTIPLVIAILMKYELNIEKNNYGDPIDILTHDKVLLVLLTLYTSSVFVLLYCI